MMLKFVIPVLILTTLLMIQTATVSALDPAGRRDATRGGERRQEIKERVAQRIETIEQRLENLRAHLATREAQLRVKLDRFKDKRKANLAERINANLIRIHENRMRSFNLRLDVMTKILQKLEAKVNQVTDKDTAKAKQAIASASASIQVARDAVEEASSTAYTVTINSETTVRQDAKKTRDELHSDLRSINRLVIDAKKAVANAIRVAATTLGGNSNGE